MRTHQTLQYSIRRQHQTASCHCSTTPLFGHASTLCCMPAHLSHLDGWGASWIQGWSDGGDAPPLGPPFCLGRGARSPRPARARPRGAGLLRARTVAGAAIATRYLARLRLTLDRSPDHCHLMAPGELWRRRGATAGRPRAPLAPACSPRVRMPVRTEEALLRKCSTAGVLRFARPR